MSALTDRLRAYGADMDGARDRFLGDEALYAACFSLFLTDASFQTLASALAARDYSAAFDAAHTIKGVTGNLGLTPLYQTVCTLVEALRHQDYSNLDAQMCAVTAARDAVAALQATK